MANKGTLNFNISGSFITLLARTRYKDTSDLNVGIRVLTQSLIGFPEDLAKEVVLGTKKLTGVNEVNIEEDNTPVIPFNCIQPCEIENVECGWIAPDGTVYGHKVYNHISDHIDLAVEIFKAAKYNELPKYEDEYDAEHVLEVNGYIKFEPNRVFSSGDFEPTEKQKDIVVRFAKTRESGTLLLGFNKTFNYYEINQMDMIQFKNHLFDF